MAEKTREVEVKLKAVSETAGFANFGEHLEHFIQQNRKMGKLIKETTELFGAGLGARVLTETMEGAAKAMQDYTEKVESGRATTADFVITLASGIPVIGQVVEAASHLDDAYHDMRAAQMEAAGASEEEVEAMESANTRYRKRIEYLQEARAGYQALMDATNAFGRQSASRTGVDPLEAQIHAEAERHEAANNRLRFAIVDYQEKHPHMNESQKATFEQLQQAQETEARTHELTIKNIREKARLAEQDFQRDRNHQELTQQQAHDRQMRDLAVQATADVLKAGHQQYAADSLMRKQQLENDLEASRQAEAERQRQLQELQRKRLREGKGLSDEEMSQRSAQIAQQAMAERQQMQARAGAADALAKQQFENQQRDANEQAQSDVFKAQTQLLEARGQLGDRDAQKGAERLKILLAEREQMTAIDRALRERNDLSDVQVQALLVQKSVIEQTTATQLKQLELQQIMGDPLRMYASASWSGAGPGMAAKEGARANAETERGRQLEQIARGQLGEQQTTNALIKQMLAVLTPKAGSQPNQIAFR